MSDALTELRESHEYDSNRWEPIRKEAKTDMQYVGGDPWDKDDKDARKNRPTVAPEEMGQYFNQVINALRANPRGAKFSPVGNGANDKTAEFYQNKWREVEYRSHAQIAYIGAAENAIQRSYGFIEVGVKYANPRSANQDIWLEGFPNPDMVLPDTDAIRPDGSDMTRALVYKWMAQSEFKRTYKQAKVTNFGDVASSWPQFVQGQNILIGKYWRITTTPRKLLLVQPPVRPGEPPPQPMQVFEDEFKKVPGGGVVLRVLRTVDYPKVTWHLTNGLEVLDEGDWLGKYIPIVSCFGKVIYAEGDTGMERKILSMTRFGRDPWKSYCYACSQQLEVLAMIPKSPLMAVRGQFKGLERDVEEAMHKPKAFLYYEAVTEATGNQVLGAPTHADYPAGQHLQALEIVKEGFRRAIQSAMGSNFMPTQAQRRNEKSGVALDKIEQAAAQGTYHFINSYEDMIRQAAVIGEDLMDKIHDYRGELDVIEADGAAARVPINDPNNAEAISTKGDHVVTISTAPSSDSERDAAESFTDTLVSNIAMVAQVSGQKAAAAVLARSVRMRNLGPQGDQLADIIEPPEYKTKNGEQPSPELMAAQAQIQQLEQQLQQAGMVIQTKQVEGQTKYFIEKMKVDATSQDKAADREVKLAVAAIQAKVDRMALLLEESRLVGIRHLDGIDGQRELLHDDVQRTKDREHDRQMADLQHQNALDAGAQGVAGQLAIQAAQPQPQPGAEAGA